MPAVKEALGCLIPPELDESLDGKRVTRGQGGHAGGEAPVGVFVRAGGWRVAFAKSGHWLRGG